MAEVQSRMRQLVGSTVEWTSNDLVIGNGEIAVERVNATTVKLKVGDGVRRFSALPYASSSIASSVVGGMTFKGAINISTPAPTSVAGDYYAASADGVAHSSWAGLSGTINRGDLVLYDGTNWHSIVNDADLTKYLPLIGGTLTGPLNGTTATFSDAVVLPGTEPTGRQAVSREQADRLYAPAGVGSGFLTVAAAAATYLPTATAAATYLPSTTAAATYLPLSGGTLNGSLSVNGTITATGNITAFSDARLKTDLAQISDALAKVCSLTGYTYTRKDTGDRQTGLLAQDVENVLPEAVMRGEYLALAYGNLMGLMVEAVKELTERVKALEVR